MGTLANLAPTLGILAGFIIANLTPYELKQGKKYFRMLMYLLLATVASVAVWQYSHGLKIDLSIPFFLLFIPVGTVYHRKCAFLIGVAAVYVTGVLISAHV